MIKNFNCLTFVVLFFLIINLFVNVNYAEETEIYYTTINYVNKIKIHKIVDNDLTENDWVVKGMFINYINSTGFSFLEIETNPKFSDFEQAIHAGYLEGNLTKDLIYSHWYNTIYDFRTTENKTVCKKIDNFLNVNTNWILEELHNHKNSSYWYHIALVYAQLKGMFNGYNSETDPKYRLTWNDILWLSLSPDVQSLYEPLSNAQTEGDGHCSAFIRILPGYKDIYFGHNTWESYQNMLRIQKRYNLKYRILPKENKIIPGSVTSFTSYPGTIFSIDDFYLISSGLAVTETTNEMYNKTLWQYITPKNMVWENIRSVLANRLTNSGKEWSDIFKLYNSGTYNNQWMILDYKKFKPGRKPYNDTFWVVEQMPSLVISKDLTNILINKTYWSSYNVPYYKEIYDISGYNDMYKKYGDWFTHEGTPRAKIFKRDYIKVNDMDSFMALMRSNNYKNEPFARCKCNPPYTAAGAIASRADLNPKNGTYQFKGLGHKPSGATDAKITNSSLFMKLQFISISGPTTGTNGVLPPFKWSTSDFDKTPHRYHPDEWNFQPVLYKWKL